MNFADISWTFAFTFLQVSICVVNSINWTFLNNKPLGQQTLFDAIVKDLAIVITLVNLDWSLTIVLTRFGSVTEALKDNEVVLGLVSSVYLFVFVFVCVYVSLVCFATIICVFNIGLLDEWLGETLVRVWMVIVSAAVSFLTCLVHRLYASVDEGLVYYIVTGERSNQASGVNSIIITIYFCLGLIAFGLLQAVFEWTKYMMRKSLSIGGNLNYLSGQGITANEVYGNGRLVASFFFLFSIGMLIFTWLVPSERKKVNTVIATIFVFNLNLYVLVPLMSILKNEKLRNFAYNKILNFMETPLLKFEFKIAKMNQVSPA